MSPELRLWRNVIFLFYRDVYSSYINGYSLKSYENWIYFDRDIDLVCELADISKSRVVKGYERIVSGQIRIKYFDNSFY